MKLSTVASLAGIASVASALSQISVKGSKFFDGNGNQYFIKGIAYQLTPDDPLTNPSQCTLDANLMKSIGTNAIRVYHVDPAGDHQACMSTFNDAGIYLWVDLDTFDTQIEQDSPHWNQTQFDRFQKVMDEFVKYDNTAGFFVGNEVLTTGNGSVAAPFVKAAARDMKAYRNSKGYRNIPIGYSAADISTLRPMLQNYMACGTNASESLDFFSLNAYEWCGQSSFEQSGYQDLTKNASSYNIPIFLSETGCMTPKPRTFDDQAAIFGSQMNNVWSGAIIYEWIEESNDYGLISYGASVAPTATAGGAYDGYTRTGTPTPINPDFSNLSNHWKTLTPTGVKASAYTPSLTAPPCPAFTADVWEVNGGVGLPTLGQTYNAAVQSSITAGTAAASAASGQATGASSTGTAAAASASKTGAASPAREIYGASIGLMGVLIGCFWWL